MRHVANRINVDQEGDFRDSKYHHRRQLVDSECPIDLKRSRGHPVKQIDLLHLTIHHHIDEYENRR